LKAAAARIGEYCDPMDRLLAQPPAAAPPREPTPKPSPKLPGRQLDADLLSLARRQKINAGIFPGVPFN
jgi:hypothetical protein